jgi:hypothetical protein
VALASGAEEMKRVKKISGWTDYPFVELGDAAFQPAPIRHVDVVRYDGNKYVTVSLDGSDVLLSFKAGYLYRQRGRYGQVKTINRRKLERMLPQPTKEHS